MSTHEATISWKRTTDDFNYDTISRNHTWSFSNGQSLRASSAPDFLGDPACVDPEEALAAAVSSCHMLTFLAIAARKRYVVESYDDTATAHLEKDSEGALAVTRVDLHPVVSFSGERQPDREDLQRLHDSAHRNCFIARSVKAQINVILP